MAPVISGMSRAEEAVLLSSLLSKCPTLQVDMLKASAAVKEGENYMSVVTRVDVVGHDLANGESVNHSLIVKSLPQSLERRLMFRCDAAFSNEAAFYSQVVPSMQTLSSKLPFPHCLHAADNLIILRHLSQDGFLMVDRREGLDLQHCELVMQELGRFHSISLAMKHNRPEEFVNMTSAVSEIFITKDNIILDACVDNCIDMALKVATDKDSSTINKLKAVRGHGLKVLSPLVTPSEPTAVICHGDLWSNNLLFRYSTRSPKTPSEVCFLDLQGCRYASPALDILYFLFSSSRPGVARQHFHQLITAYHCALVEHMRLLAPLALVVTLDDVMAEVRQHAKFGLVMSLMVLPAVTAEEISINLDNVTEESFQSQQFQDEAEKGLLTPGYKSRVNENLEVFCMEGLL